MPSRQFACQASGSESEDPTVATRRWNCRASAAFCSGADAWAKTTTASSHPNRYAQARRRLGHLGPAPVLAAMGAGKVIGSRVWLELKELLGLLRGLSWEPVDQSRHSPVASTR